MARRSEVVPKGLARAVIKAIDEQKLPTKAPRTLSLTSKSFERLQIAAKRLNTTPSAIIDQLIVQFLVELGDEVDGSAA